MSHFEKSNPSIQLLQRDRYGLDAGKFITKEVEEINCLGSQIKVKVLDMRPVVVIFNESGPSSCFRTVNSPAYQTALAEVLKIERLGRNTYGCHGYEIAMEVQGQKYILSCCSASSRQLAHQFSQNLGRTVIIDTVKMSTGRFDWYAMEVWVNAYTVTEYVRPESCCDDEQLDEDGF